jgi:hypothetical protein
MGNIESYLYLIVCITFLLVSCFGITFYHVTFTNVWSIFRDRLFNNSKKCISVEISDLNVCACLCLRPGFDSHQSQVS